jgi:tRNA dimethylallyltransferase
MNQLIVIGGATATGKSNLALEVASEIGAEIVNADSMQLYIGMNIGTAKLSIDERKSITHHLLDVVEVSEDVTVSWYQEKARALIDNLLKTKPVVVVGGTGLYIKSILDDLNFPETNDEIREALTKLAEEIGPDALHEKLASLDPAAALAIPKENIRRVVRALEVIEITGKPFTANLPREGSTKYPLAKQYAIEVDREELDQRVENRVDQMWQLGFVDEVKSLIEKGLLTGRTAKQAIGYSQIINFLNKETSESDAKELTKIATRQYVRRQETWFKKDERITWLEGDINRKQAIINDILKA